MIVVVGVRHPYIVVLVAPIVAILHELPIAEGEALIIFKVIKRNRRRGRSRIPCHGHRIQKPPVIIRPYGSVSIRLCLSREAGLNIGERKIIGLKRIRIPARYRIELFYRNRRKIRRIGIVEIAVTVVGISEIRLTVTRNDLRDEFWSVIDGIPDQYILDSYPCKAGRATGRRKGGTRKIGRIQLVKLVVKHLFIGKLLIGKRDDVF